MSTELISKFTYLFSSRGDPSYFTTDSSTPFETLDIVLDSSVTDEQVLVALDQIKNKKELFPDNAQYLWRLAKATFIYANQCVKKDPTRRTDLLREAKEYADLARKLDATSPDVLKWSALTTGGLARYADTNQKINFGLTTREFLQSAMELRPNDPSLHHILGRWIFEISQLGWLERTAVRTLFGKYAHVDVKDARECFLKAETLKPKMFKSNMYYIAKVFLLHS